MLTNSELNQIKNFLALYGKKDSQLSPVTTVDNTDYVAIVQNATNKNVRITIELLKKAVLEGIIYDHTFDFLWDDKPTKDSDKAVRSKGLYEDSQDLHSKAEKFVVTLSANPVNFEITGNELKSTLSTTNRIEVFGDAGSEIVTPSDSWFTTIGGSISGNTWTLPQAAGTYTATYNAIYNNISKNDSVNANVYLRKYFGFSTNQPSDVTTLSTSDAKATVNCTITIDATDSGFKYIWLAVPSNMSINDVIQTNTGYKLELHDFGNNTYYTATTRTINGVNYTYKLYRSERTVDTAYPTTLRIS